MAAFKASNQMTSTPILRLNIDCCDEILEFVSLPDLHSLALTCKAMQRVTGEYFQRNFKSATKCVYSKGAHVLYCKCVDPLPGFHPFFDSLAFEVPDSYDFVDGRSNEFKSVKKIILHRYKLPHGSLKEILPQIEAVKLVQFVLNGDLHECILKFCKNIKEIDVADDNRRIVNTNGNKWLNQVYPSLEKFHLKTTFGYEINELSSFLRRNSSIQMFLITADTLIKNGYELLKSGVKLDLLKVHEGYAGYYMELQSLHNLFNQLYERGFYKRLHFNDSYRWHSNQNDLDMLASFRGIESLTLNSISKDCNFSSLKNLKYFCFFQNISSDYNISLFECLVNVEHIFLSYARYDIIRTLIRKLKHLKTLRIYKFEGILNLATLSNERKKLSEAREVIIYIEESIFLETKWLTRNGYTGLIEIRRLHSCELD